MNRSAAIRLIAIDLDRTLLDDHRALSDANLAALRAAHERDVAIAICSGRDVPATLAITRQIVLPCWLVVQNGSLVLGPDGGAILTCTLASAVARRIIDVLEAHGLIPVVYDLHPRSAHLWCQEGADAAPGVLEFRREHGAEIELVADIRSALAAEVSHVEVFGPREAVFAAVRDLDGDARLATIVNLSSSRRDSGLLGVYAAGTSKERALALVAAHLGVGAEAVLAIGDNLNDVGMVRWAGVGVMVANGPDAALAAADWVAPSNNESGVAAAIERFVLSGGAGRAACA